MKIKQFNGKIRQQDGELVSTIPDQIDSWLEELKSRGKDVEIVFQTQSSAEQQNNYCVYVTLTITYREVNLPEKVETPRA